jgi:GMP synthase-like glutamine amidotransferase
VSTALVITHDPAEGPGLVATWLAEGGLDGTVVEPWNGDKLPESLDGYAALVVMGGPHQAYDDGSAPWLRRTKELLRSAVAAALPTFTICLGAQLLAEATGGRAAVGESGPELGAKLVAKRDQAGGDPLFWDLPLSPMVIQWHWDVVADLPPAATLLMSSPTYPHQAFRVGDRAWGRQFHVETPPEMLETWVGQSAAELVALGRDPQAILDRALPELEEVYEVWGEVVRRFARLAAGG